MKIFICLQTFKFDFKKGMQKFQKKATTKRT